MATPGGGLVSGGHPATGSGGSLAGGGGCGVYSTPGQHQLVAEDNGADIQGSASHHFETEAESESESHPKKTI